MAISLGDAILNLGLNDAELTNGLQSVENNLTSRFLNMRTIIGGAMTAVGAGILGVAGSAVSSASEFDSASKKMAVSLGQPLEKAQEFDEVIKEVYGNNFGETIEDVGEAATKVAQSLGTIGITGTDEISKATQSAIALRDTFEVDVAESMDAVKTLVENFGISSTEAFDFVTAGFQKGLNGSGDFVDSIREYSVQFKEGGATADQFFSVLETGLQGGVLGTDKAADMFKEFRVRILDGSKATTDALAQLGINHEEFLGKLSSGQMTIAEAFGLVQEKLRGTNDQSVLMQAGVGLLGTQFEDLGATAALAIDMTKTKMTDLAGSTEGLNGQYKTTAATWSELGRNIQILFADVGTTAVPMLNDLLLKIVEVVKGLREWVKEHPQLSQAIFLIVTAIGALFAVLGPILMVLPGLAVAFAGITSVLPALGAAFAFITGPIGLAIAAIVAIIAAAWALYENWDSVVGFLGGLWDGFVDLLSAAWDGIKSVFNAGVDFVTMLIEAWWNWQQMKVDLALSIWDAFRSGVAMIWDGVVSIFQGAWDAIRGIWDSITGLVSSGFDAIAGPIQSLINLIGNLGSAAGSIGQFSIPGFASGTLSAPGGLAIVGEEGPELINLPRGSRVFSNRDTQSMLGSNSVTNSFSFTLNGVDEKSARQIAAEVESAITHKMQRASSRMGGVI